MLPRCKALARNCYLLSVRGIGTVSELLHGNQAMMFFDLRTVIGFNQASTCTCSFPFFDAIVLGIRILHVNATLPNPQYILFLTPYWNLQKPGWYRKEHRSNTEKTKGKKFENKYGITISTACTVYVNGRTVDKVLLYVKEAIGVIGVAGMLSATKDQPANTEGKKKSLTLCFTDFLIFYFISPQVV